MADYLLIESRDPFESNDVSFLSDLARGLSDAGNGVTVYLVQNAVLAARASARAPALQSLIGSDVKILADDFSLLERGITILATGVETASIETIVDRMEAGDKTIWH